MRERESLPSLCGYQGHESGAPDAHGWISAAVISPRDGVAIRRVLPARYLVDELLMVIVLFIQHQIEA